MSMTPEEVDGIEEVAAMWLAEREEDLSSSRKREFDRWCRADSRPAAAVARLEQACALLEELPRVRVELQPVVEFPVGQPRPVKPKTESRRIPWRRVAKGLTAALALAALGWWPQPPPTTPRASCACWKAAATSPSSAGVNSKSSSASCGSCRLSGPRKKKMAARITHLTRWFVSGALPLLPMMPPLVTSAPVVALAAGYAFAPAAVGAAESPRERYDIARGDAADTLKHFAGQSGRQVVYLVDTVRGVVTNPVNGEFTAREVLDQLLRRTVLQVVEDAKSGALLIQRAPAPKPAARSSLPSASAPEPQTKGIVKNPRAKSPAGWLPALLVFLAAADAQTVGSPPTTPSSAAAETLTLSPFEVKADYDGYYASNTTAGTRLNSSLDDLASSTPIVTKQQMADFALLDINDIFAYGVGTEGRGTFTDAEVDHNGSPVDTTSNNPSQANRLSGIGSANLYVPTGRTQPMPGVLGACGQSNTGKAAAPTRCSRRASWAGLRHAQL